jgi:hypothetical protein
MARLRDTTGDGAIANKWSYRAKICGQSVSSMVGASAWTALMAAWSLYGPGLLRRKHPRTIGLALLDQGPIPACAVLLAERDEGTVRPRS